MIKLTQPSALARSVWTQSEVNLPAERTTSWAPAIRCKHQSNNFDGAMQRLALAFQFLSKLESICKSILLFPLRSLTNKALMYSIIPNRPNTNVSDPKLILSSDPFQHNYVLVLASSLVWHFRATVSMETWQHYAVLGVSYWKMKSQKLK